MPVLGVLDQRVGYLDVIRDHQAEWRVSLRELSSVRGNRTLAVDEVERTW